MEDKEGIITQLDVGSSSSAAGKKALNEDHDVNPNPASAGNSLHLPTGKMVQPKRKRSCVENPSCAAGKAAQLTEAYSHPYPGRSRVVLKKGGVVSWEPCRPKLYRSTGVRTHSEVKLGMSVEPDFDFKDDPTYKKLVAAGAHVKVAGRGYVAWMPKEKLLK